MRTNTHMSTRNVSSVARDRAAYADREADGALAQGCREGVCGAVQGR